MPMRKSPNKARLNRPHQLGGISRRKAIERTIAIVALGGYQMGHQCLDAVLRVNYDLLDSARNADWLRVFWNRATSTSSRGSGLASCT